MKYDDCKMGGCPREPQKICGHCAGFEKHYCIEKDAQVSLLGTCEQFVGSHLYQIKVESYKTVQEETPWQIIKYQAS